MTVSISVLDRRDLAHQELGAALQADQAHALARPDSAAITMAMLRSLTHAEYSPANVGHFGLALESYAHFTSPIRRYPDLLVHRAIRHIVRGGKPGKYNYGAKDMERLGVQPHSLHTGRGHAFVYQDTVIGDRVAELQVGSPPDTRLQCARTAGDLHRHGIEFDPLKQTVRGLVDQDSEGEVGGRHRSGDQEAALFALEVIDEEVLTIERRSQRRVEKPLSARKQVGRTRTPATVDILR